MGLYLSRFYELLASWNASNPMRILIVGLDTAGKATILYKLKLNENVVTTPPSGLNVKTVQPVNGVTFTVWDVGAQTKLRPLWKYYCDNTQGLAYVIDSSDQERINEAAEGLHAVCEDDNMRGVPVVIIANKQDLPNAMTCSQLIEKLNLNKLNETKNKWFIQPSCAITGEGIYESMEKLYDMIKESQI